MYRLAYPVYLLEKLLQTKNGKHIMVLYDIACLLETHLRVSPIMSMLYTYNYSCRIVDGLTCLIKQHLGYQFSMCMVMVPSVRSAIIHIRVYTAINCLAVSTAGHLLP